MGEEKAASGIECEELSEKDTLIEELTEQERSFQAKEKSTAKDKGAAEYVWRTAIELMKDSKKKTSQDSGFRTLGIFEVLNALFFVCCFC